jgi:glycosyltransferase involved in cell wall biosynthesis
MARMIRILYVEGPSHVGGSVISLYYLVAHLDRAAFDPLVLFRRPHPYRERFEAIGVPVITLAEEPPKAKVPSRQVSQQPIAAMISRYARPVKAGYQAARWVYHLLGSEWPMARRIRQIIEAEGVDLVHTNNNLPRNRAGVLAARLAGVPVVCHYRMFEPINGFDRWLGRYVATHVYISKAVAAHFIAQGLPPERAKVVYNAVDLDQFDPPGDGAAVRRELGLRPEHLVVGNVGRLDWWKGHDVFLPAVARLAACMPDLRALIVGGADDRLHNQAYASRLRVLTEELGLAKRVIFTGHRDDISDVMAASDLVVHSATQPEPFGRVVIEALAACRPVVAMAAGGVPEIIEDGVHGLLVPPGDVEALAEAMTFLLSNTQAAKAMARMGHQRVCQQFTIQAQMAAVQALYRAVPLTCDQRSSSSLKLRPRTGEDVSPVAQGPSG